MGEQTKKLPIGYENFSEIRKKNFYYVDKTAMISDLISENAKVTLFTRPRRFGKSLNMSMLKCFFEVGCDRELFEGLKISEETELCEQYMGQFPVITLSLKGVDGRNFETARSMLCSEIGNEAQRLSALQTSTLLNETDKDQYAALLRMKNGNFLMSDEVLCNSLKRLTYLLEKHYGRKIILLIDEYDVPLDKAYQNGYYDEMVALLRTMFSQVLKTNDSLQFAVLTGCLRISRESIFTGLNNLRTQTIMDSQFDEYFGFTDKEVCEMLEYYGVTDVYTTVKEWYDGYLFGSKNIYCPWDVINYCADLRANPNAWAKDYWSNTSSNAIVRILLQKATAATKRELESLIAGESIHKTIKPELTYRELDDSTENIWSVLFMTGYLTATKAPQSKTVDLAIPNKEVREIFMTQIQEWFEKLTSGSKGRLDRLCAAFLNGNSEIAEEELNFWLRKTISIRDASASPERKEHFYHGVLLGLLSHAENWYLSSNAEAGEGYCDIFIEDEEHLVGIVMELKYAENGDLDAACQKAFMQMEERKYADVFLDDGMKTIWKYCIAFYKKRCKVIRLKK